MDRLNRLFGGTRGEQDTTPFEDLSLEEQQEILAEEKAERIKYHRKSVRNGPIKFRTITSGQQRRQAARDQKTLERKVNLRHRRNFKQKQLAVAVLRAKLQAVGVLPFVAENRASLGAFTSASQWIVAKFGRRDNEGALIFDDNTLNDAIKAAAEEYRNLTAKRAA